MGVAPWALLEREDGQFWRGWALTAEAAEAEAQEVLARQRK